MSKFQKSREKIVFLSKKTTNSTPHLCSTNKPLNMIHIIKQPETKPYLPPSVKIAWVKIHFNNADIYSLEGVDALPVLKEKEQSILNTAAIPENIPYATLTLLESGAILATFPLLSKLPGSIQADKFTVWFNLDAPAHLPANVLGSALEIAAGKYLMTQSVNEWIVFFKPSKSIITTS
jgi:hypothetical protein